MIDASDPDRYFLALWFVPGTQKDWLCCIWRNKQTGKIGGMYRFRYHAKGSNRDLFNDEDKKSWYSLETHRTDEKQLIIDHTHGAQLVAHQPGFWGIVDFLPIDGDQKKLLAELQKKPWAHIKSKKAD